jgi:serine/threonine protein phosphatase PrpC
MRRAFMDQCPTCGNERRPGARFCKQCGQPFLDPAGPANPAFSIQPTLPAWRVHDDPTTIEPPPTEAKPPAAYAALMDTISTVPPATNTPDFSLESDFDQPPPAAPELSPLLAGRYRLTRALPAAETGATLHAAEDWLTCGSCNALQSDPNERYCLMCGAELTTRPVVQLRELAAAEATETDLVDEQGRRYQLIPAPAPLAATPPPVPGLHLSAAAQTHPGLVRDIDEDSVLIMQLTALCEARPALSMGLFAVADGIGGADAGEVASRAASRALAESILTRVFAPLAGGDSILPEALETHLREAIHIANRAVLAAREQRQLDLGCTLTAALVVGDQALVANLGDSRAYLMRGGRLAQITQDHSVVASLIAAGLAQPEEIYTHEKKGVIYRSLGEKPELEIDTFALTLQPGDRMLLCCDGLWEMARDPLIEDTLLQHPEDSRRACATLIKLANSAGGEDNISVIVMDVLPTD